MKTNPVSETRASAASNHPPLSCFPYLGGFGQSEWIGVGLFLLMLVAIYLLHLPLIVQVGLMILTLIKASSMLGKGTEEIANHYSPSIGGLLNASFGNLAELIITFFAIRAGLIEIAKAAITGAIMGNALMVLGIAIIVGGFKRKEMELDSKEANMTSTMLAMAVLLLLLPSALFLFHEQTYEKEVSIAAASIMLVIYFASLVFSLYTHKEWFASAPHEEPKLGRGDALLLMLVSILMLGVASESFASNLENLAQQFGLTELFIGAVLVGIAGSAEHLSAITFAAKDKMSLAMSITIGSALQLAMLVAPLLVFLALFFQGSGPYHSPIAFLPIEIFAILSSVYLINEIARDGRVNWLEGLQLLALYVGLAVLFFFYHG